MHVSMIDLAFRGGHQGQVLQSKALTLTLTITFVFDFVFVFAFVLSCKYLEAFTVIVPAAAFFTVALLKGLRG